MRRLIICISFALLVTNAEFMAQTLNNQLNGSGKKTGFWVYYNDDGVTKKEEGQYNNGIKDGLWKAFYPDGVVKHQIEFVNGVARGKAIFYYTDGTIWEKGIWNEYCWVGDYKLYYPNGKIAYDWKYNNQGRREGIQKYYFDNGAVKYSGKWEDGQIAGNVQVFDSTGALVQTRIYKNGIFDSAKIPESLLPENSELQPDRTFSPFHGTGYHTLYKLNGKIDQKGYFRDGKLYNGEAYVYDENGELRQIRYFENGKVIRIQPVNK